MASSQDGIASNQQQYSSNGNLQATSAVPAFLSNERMRRNSKARSSEKGLADCCYSISNMALIASCVVAIVFTAKFFNDDPLYDIGDYLLTLRFYRQLIYVIVILPLILLIPLFNAVSAFFLSSSRKRQEMGRSVIVVRVIYQILMIIGALVALAFIAPSMRAHNVSNQIDLELRKHIFRRYENQFSYEFLDRIQVEYQCCDQLYYQSNFNDKVPLSCFVQDGFYTNVFRYTCAEVLGQIVSTRCLVITICFLIILFALASLIAMDIIELVNPSNDVDIYGSRQSIHSSQGGFARVGISSNNLNDSSKHLDNLPLDNDNEILSSDQINSRLKLEERERQVPLLRPQTPPKPSGTGRKISMGKQQQTGGSSLDPYNQPPLGGTTSGPILTRANYINNTKRRPQSPIFLASNNNQDPQPGTSAGCRALTPTKSALKKSSSFLRIDSDEDDHQQATNELGRKSPHPHSHVHLPGEQVHEGYGERDDNHDDDDDDRGGESSEEEVLEYQKQLQRELQTRRSLLSVRFAE